jgi:hypothetical protein
VRSLEHNLNMSHDSWHARWYRCWIKFCGEVKEVPPYMAVGVAIYAVIFYASSIIVGVAFTVLVLMVVGVKLFKRRKPDRSKEIMLKLRSGVDWIINRRVVVWYIHKRYIGYRFTPLGITAVLALVAGLTIGLIFDPLLVLKIVLCIIAVALILGAIVGIVMGIEKIMDRRAGKRLAAKPPTRAGRAYRGTADTVKLGATYVATKKRGSRICPFIDFESDSDLSESMI